MKRLSKNKYEIKPAQSMKRFIENLDKSEVVLGSMPEQLQQSLVSIKTKKQKSLGVLCIIFIQIFLLNQIQHKSKFLTMDEVTKIFNEDLD